MTLNATYTNRMKTALLAIRKDSYRESPPPVHVQNVHAVSATGGTRYSALFEALLEKNHQMLSTFHVAAQFGYATISRPPPH